MTPNNSRSVRLPKVMYIDFLFNLSRCGRLGVYAESGVYLNADGGFYRSGFLLLKILLGFNFFEIANLYYNIRNVSLSPFMRGEKIFKEMNKKFSFVFYLQNPIKWGGYFFAKVFL